jgi:hypothetical protein
MQLYVELGRDILGPNSPPAASKWCLAGFLLAKSLNNRIFAVIVWPTPFSELPTEMTAEWQINDLTAGSLNYHATVSLPGRKDRGRCVRHETRF